MCRYEKRRKKGEHEFRSVDINTGGEYDGYRKKCITDNENTGYEKAGSVNA